MPVTSPRSWFGLLALVVFGLAATDPAANGLAAHEPEIDSLATRSAATDLATLREDVEALADLAEAHVWDVGLRQALVDFRTAPWRRDANALHVWGVTRAGVSWFDAGHPEVVGLDVSFMTDLEGRPWARLAVESADRTGESVFRLSYPHPETGRAAPSLHRCFALADGQRVLCAGAFVDRE